MPRVNPKLTQKEQREEERESREIVFLQQSRKHKTGGMIGL
jgi:hypothetical protein